ncbi:hypothetical protein BaRGS_00039202 [Batillaria attramentaria]|uniref:Zinc finger MYND domain-containing protein 11 n=1 Tax=Batillaria attramentaria TaxID=370345 RepID=A0ABD0J4P5_9CAEN
MVQPVKRRQSSCAVTKRLIEGINYIRAQKQIPNLERLSRYMQREYGTSYTECRRQLDQTVADGFIIEYTAVGFKGQRTGLEQEGYRLPADEEVDIERDDHDWFCFECHGPGDMLLCSECIRAYHTNCTKEDYSGPKFVCAVCKEIEAGKRKNKMKKKMLNTLLSYTILRLKEKTRELHKISIKGEEENYARYVYQRMDLNAMEIKVQASRYKCMEEFYADARTILHNCVILRERGLTELAHVMLRDCKYDLDEINLCPNCYYMSNAKPEQWFCQPCNPPHDLVYAKLKGFGYWPAKVINEVDGKMDVRFFGGWHQRAVIPAEYIRPITTNLQTLKIKRTAGFNKACKELKVHQQLLDERERELKEQGSVPRQAVDNDDDDKGGVPDESFVVTSSEDKVTQVTKRQLSDQFRLWRKPRHKNESASDADWQARLEKKTADVTERLKKQFDEEKEKALKELTDRLKKDFEEDKQAATKKKQWCYNCEEEAMYHCCWNTSYCSVRCQQEHWHKEHKRVCRRKR